MDRRAFITMLGGSALAAPIAAKAQQADKVHRIGLVSLGAAPTRHGMWQHLLAAMREMNYVEGQNLVVRLALAEGKPERLPGLVAELMQAKVDVIVTASTQETLAAKKATSTIPIVMTLVPDPIEQGLIASLARPGGNHLPVKCPIAADQARSGLPQPSRSVARWRRAPRRDARFLQSCAMKPGDSGYQIYDQYAENAIGLASPFPPVPSDMMAFAKPDSTEVRIRADLTYVLAAR